MALAYIILFSEYTQVEMLVDLRSELENAFNSSVYMSDNNDILVGLNDSDTVDFTYVYDIYRLMGLINDKENRCNYSLVYTGLKYSATSATEEKILELFLGIDSGFYAVKNSKLHLTFFNGLHGSSHGHASNGNISLTYDNEPIIINTGRYTYLESDIRLELKGENSQNSVSLRNSPATIIDGSWSYKKLANPLAHQLIEKNNNIIIEGSWAGTNGKYCYVIERKIVYMKDIEAIVIFDHITNPKGPIEITYCLSPEVEIDHEGDHLILNDQLVIWSSDAKIELQEQVYSPRYNEKLKSKKVVLTQKVDQEYYSNITAIVPKRMQCFSKKAKQTQSIDYSDYIKGLELKDGDYKKEIYFMTQDVVKGDKLFINDDGVKFYGKINIVDNDKMIRLR